MKIKYSFQIAKMTVYLYFHTKFSVGKPIYISHKYGSF